MLRTNILWALHKGCFQEQENDSMPDDRLRLVGPVLFHIPEEPSCLATLLCFTPGMCAPPLTEEWFTEARHQQELYTQLHFSAQWEMQRQLWNPKVTFSLSALQTGLILKHPERPQRGASGAQAAKALHLTGSNSRLRPNPPDIHQFFWELNTPSQLFKNCLKISFDEQGEQLALGADCSVLSSCYT